MAIEAAVGAMAQAAAVPAVAAEGAAPLIEAAANLGPAASEGITAGGVNILAGKAEAAGKLAGELESISPDSALSNLAQGAEKKVVASGDSAPVSSTENADPAVTSVGSEAASEQITDAAVTSSSEQAESAKPAASTTSEELDKDPKFANILGEILVEKQTKGETISEEDARKEARLRYQEVQIQELRLENKAMRAEMATMSEKFKDLIEFLKGKFKKDSKFFETLLLILGAGAISSFKNVEEANMKEDQLKPQGR